jgi:hypothetical protein
MITVGAIMPTGCCPSCGASARSSCSASQCSKEQNRGQTTRAQPCFTTMTSLAGIAAPISTYAECRRNGYWFKGRNHPTISADRCWTSFRRAACEPHRVRRGVKSGIVDRAQQIVCFLECCRCGRRAPPTPFVHRVGSMDLAVRLCTSCRRPRHLGQVAAFDPDPCTADPDRGPSGAVLRQTQPRLQHERLAPFGKRSC